MTTKHGGKYGSKEYFRNRNRSSGQQAHRRKWNKKNPHVMRKISAGQRKNNPSHVAARKKAQSDKGPHKCARCDKAATAAHHTSYDPPKHVWLCKEHHDKAHYTRPNVRRTLASKGLTVPSMRKAFIDEMMSRQERHEHNILPGGVGDHLTALDVDLEELEEGIRHEKEHTPNEHIAAEIALDHLAEDPAYYHHLEEMEYEQEQAKKAVGATPPRLTEAKRIMDRTPPQHDGQALHRLVMQGGDKPKFHAPTSNGDKPEVARHKKRKSNGVGPVCKGPPGYPGRPDKVKLVVPASVNRPDHLGSPDHLGTAGHFSFSKEPKVEIEAEVSGHKPGDKIEIEVEPADKDKDKDKTKKAQPRLTVPSTRA